MSFSHAPSKWSPDLLQALHPIESARLFLKGATLFEQGSAATGIYLVKSGEVRVLLLTGQNQAQLLEVAGPGTMLGLSEATELWWRTFRARSLWRFSVCTLISAGRCCGT